MCCSDRRTVAVPMTAPGLVIDAPSEKSEGV